MYNIGHKNLVSIAQSIILVIFTSYSFLFAKNIDSIGNSVLLVMSLICLVTLTIVKPDLSFFRSSLHYLSVFFFLCILSIIFPIWPNTEINWTYSAVCKCILGLSIVLIFNSQGSSWINQNTWIVFLALCFLMILQNTGFNIKENLEISFFDCALGAWNEKHHTFWLVILFWPTMYSIKFSSKYNKVITVVFFLFALLSSYSESAKVAIVLSVIIFITSKFKPIITWMITYWCMLLYSLLFPFIFQIISFTEMEFLSYRTYNRFALFETSSNLIMNNLTIGSGFGSSLSIDIFPHIPSSIEVNRVGVQLSDGSVNFLGGHPHNFVALIWIEFGLIGALMLTFFLYRFNQFIIKIIKHSDAAPYIISIITTVVILFSCSWSIWQTDVVLTYIMFIACLSFLITAGNHKKENSLNAVE